MRVVVWILSGLAAGWIARVAMRRRSHGVLVDLALGLTGALVGGTIMRRAGVTFSGSGPAEVVVGAIGAMAVIGVARIFGLFVERAGFPASAARLPSVVPDLVATIGGAG